MINDKNDLFSRKLETKDVKIDGYGTFRIIEVSAEAQQNFEKVLEEKKSKIDAMCQLIVDSVIREDSSTLFSKEDIPKLKKLPVKPILELFNAILKLNKIGQEEVEDLAKNS